MSDWNIPDRKDDYPDHDFEPAQIGKEGKTGNEELYEKAKEAITELFSDQSVSISTCRENLENLKGEIDIMLDTLPEEEGI